MRARGAPPLHRLRVALTPPPRTPAAELVADVNAELLHWVDVVSLGLAPPA